MGFGLSSVFGGGNPISAILGGGSSNTNMSSGGIGSSTGNTNAQTTTTNTDTKNEDRRLVIAEGGIGINSEGQGVTLNVYSGRDATQGAGYTEALNNATPGGAFQNVAGFDWATWFEDNKLLIAGGGAGLVVLVAIYMATRK